MRDERQEVADELLQQLTVSLYEPPYDRVRQEDDYPQPSNPLHVAALLIDAHTEIAEGGVLAFLENPAGQHLEKTAEVLEALGAVQAAAVLRKVLAVMQTYGVTWKDLRIDPTGLSAFQISSFREAHGKKADAFVAEVTAFTDGFDPFVGLDHRENPYQALVGYVAGRLDEFRAELARRRTNPPV